MMKQIAYIAGILIIPGLLNPAAAHFRFEGLAPFSHDYCSGLPAEPAEEARAADEVLLPSHGPQPAVRPWVAYGCKDASGKIIKRAPSLPHEEPKEPKTK